MAMGYQDEDDAFLQQLVLSEEDRKLRHPATKWTGGYRWFKAPNVVRLELFRSPADMDRICAVILGQPRTEVGTLRSKVGA